MNVMIRVCFVTMVALVWMVGCGRTSPPMGPDGTPGRSTDFADPGTAPITTELSPEEIITVEILAMLTSTTAPELYDSYPSPDGMWRVDIQIYPCTPLNEGNENSYEELLLVRVGDDSARTADSQLIYCGGLGAYGLEGLSWSPNSNYFYYTDAREGVPDGCGNWRLPIYQLEIASLTKERIGNGSLSPDGMQFALWQSDQLLLWDLDDGEQVRLPLLEPDALSGPVAWAPDGQSLAYLQYSAVCPLTGPSHLVLVDTVTHERRKLLESTTPVLGAIAWTEVGQISLFDEGGEEWRYDLETGELTK